VHMDDIDKQDNTAAPETIGYTLWLMRKDELATMTPQNSLALLVLLGQVETGVSGAYSSLK